MSDRFCRDCKHVTPVYGWRWLLAEPACILSRYKYTQTNLVTGVSKTHVGHTSCESERFDRSGCGRDGVRWEPKP